MIRICFEIVAAQETVRGWMSEIPSLDARVLLDEKEYRVQSVHWEDGRPVVQLKT
jgi:hypothetical protein